jgi:hypothetical protein
MAYSLLSSILKKINIKSPCLKGLLSVVNNILFFTILYTSTKLKVGFAPYSFFFWRFFFDPSGRFQNQQPLRRTLVLTNLLRRSHTISLKVEH